MKIFHPGRKETYFDVQPEWSSSHRFRGSDARKARMAFGMLLILLLALAISYELNVRTYIGYARPRQTTIVRQEALEALGKKYVAQQDYLEAILVFETLVETYPRSRLADQALCRVGLCWLSLNETDMAIATWERFLQLYPDSKYAPRVRQSYLILVKDHLRGVPV